MTTRESSLSYVFYFYHKNFIVLFVSKGTSLYLYNSNRKDLHQCVHLQVSQCPDSKEYERSSLFWGGGSMIGFLDICCLSNEVYKRQTDKEGERGIIFHEISNNDKVASKQ